MLATSKILSLLLEKTLVNNSISYQKPLCGINSPDLACPSSHSKVSQDSFKKMTNYVKNTFRKGKVSGRKNSHYSYSSHRRKDPLSNTLMKKGKRSGKFSDILSFHFAKFLK